MLNRSVLFLLIVALALVASPGLAPPPVAAQDFLVVDDDGPPSCAPVSNVYTTIAQALAAANPSDTIYVCDGDYTEPSMVITDDYLTITGPGATPEDDGVATVHHNGLVSAMFAIQANYVVVQGLDLDATPPPGFGAGQTIGIENHGTSVAIEDNEIRNATGPAVSSSGGTRYVQILNNNIHDIEEGVTCYCDDSDVAGNSVSVSGNRALEFVGDGNGVTANVMVNGRVSASGDGLLISGNEITGGTPGEYLLSVSGSGAAVIANSVAIMDNTFSGASGFGIRAEPGSASTSFTIAQNTFAHLDVPIYLVDSNPADGAVLTATVGGSEADANTFIDSGGTLTDGNHLLSLAHVSLDVDAEYNNWGLCTAAEIEQEIFHQPDNPALGVVDFEPFIAPSSCSAATPTPTPGGRVLTIPPGSWANFAWTGVSSPQSVADCFGAGNISVMYRLDAAAQSYQRWIGSRPDLSDMGQVAQYDTLLALNSSSQPASCTPPDVMLLGRTVTIPAGLWANFAWSGNVTLASNDVADCFGQGNISVMYRLDAATQSYQRWIRGRPDLSDMGNVAPFDTLLALSAGSQDGSCDIPIMVT